MCRFCNILYILHVINYRKSVFRFLLIIDNNYHWCVYRNERIRWSAKTSAIIASATGTRRGGIVGSCRPTMLISVLCPVARLTVFCVFEMEGVGLSLIHI